MTNYQVLARKYRPQRFTEILGQDAIVTTLKNAIKFGRLAHAYLFSGSRGTGKTTLARVLAKALNCQNPSPDGEPCCQCSTCKEIKSGNSLDVLEIDGASNRGIDDIRQINETVGYASTSGKFKIYIIDEVHMLTKEAFNALLKTLEEPPPKVIFIFATTEPHKVLPTILSRCQRFNLKRISTDNIIQKLKNIAEELHISIDDDAVRLLAQSAEGGLRDAESLFDQIISFHHGKITLETVTDVLGIMPKDTLFALDAAGKEGRFFAAFEIAHQIFTQGKDILQFVESLTDHFRTLLLVKLSGTSAPFLSISENDKQQYELSAKLYSQEQCLTILDILVESQNQIRFHTSARISLEALLLKIMRTHHRLPVGYLVKRLSELEQLVQGTSIPTLQASKERDISEAHIVCKAQEAKIQESDKAPEVKREEVKSQEVKSCEKPINSSITEDPTPTPQELGFKPSSAKPSPPPPVPQTPSLTPSAPLSKPHNASRYDTLLQFSAVELEGTVQKKH